MRWGSAAAEKLRWGLRASCSGYRLTEASDPATTNLSKVTQAKSEHKRLFLPALLEPASIKSSAGSLSLKMADSSKHLWPKLLKLLKLFRESHTSSPCPNTNEVLYYEKEFTLRAFWFVCTLKSIHLASVIPEFLKFKQERKTKRI